jgi:hypothetical protein
MSRPDVMTPQSAAPGVFFASGATAEFDRFRHGR